MPELLSQDQISATGSPERTHPFFAARHESPQAEFSVINLANSTLSKVEEASQRWYDQEHPRGFLTRIPLFNVVDYLAQILDQVLEQAAASSENALEQLKAELDRQIGTWVLLDNEGREKAQQVLKEHTEKIRQAYQRARAA
mgnify:CR=1 FL=1